MVKISGCFCLKKFVAKSTKCFNYGSLYSQGCRGATVFAGKHTFLLKKKGFAKKQTLTLKQQFLSWNWKCMEQLVFLYF